MPMGRYRTRQYELVLVDRVPTGIFAVEERTREVKE
jgi:hypothetical protein